ncbi:MAG: BLUF domain-containing protein [Wenzhouxiangellaceae bacterium]
MDSPGDLICLSYGSRASFEQHDGPDGIHPEINRILTTARRLNSQLAVTGVLYYGGGCFFQYLEGPADNVDRLYASICRDQRHHDVERLTRRSIGKRRYPEWSMKFVGLERLVSEILRRHGIKTFDPFQFTPAIVDDLVLTCTKAPDHTPETTRDSGQRRRGFLGRWFT